MAGPYGESGIINPSVGRPASIATARDTEEGNVLEQMRRLSASVEDLHSRISYLDQRLDMVLMPMPGNAVASAKDDPRAAPMPVASNLASGLRDIVDSIDGASRRIVHLRDRVDV